MGKDVYKRQILGYYTYYNEIGEQVRNTFYETEFTTEGIEGLEKINLSYDGVEPGSTYANIKGLYITNERESEVLKGIDHFAIEIEGEEYPFSNSISSSLTKLEKVDYTTPYILKSNTEYNLKIKAYDVGGNELEVNHQEIQIKTSKQTPTCLLYTSTTFIFFEPISMFSSKYFKYFSLIFLVSCIPCPSKKFP